MTPHPPFTNPYRSYSGETIRLNLDASRDDVVAIRLVLMEQGSIQTAWALFLQHLADYVRTNNYTIADREAFINHIFTRCSASSADNNPSGGNVGRPTPRLRKVCKGAENVTAVGSGK